MPSIYRYLIILFLLATAQYPAARLQAQPRRVPADSSQVQVRTLPAATLDKYRNDKDFNYRQQHARGASLWERFWDWVGDNFSTLASSKGWWGFMKLLLWGICIFVFVYAILKLTGMQRAALFTGNKKAAELDYTVTDDDIYSINFGEAINNAIAQKNYRLAIRLLYLQTLRRMADRELIHWKLNKTNDIYAQELHGSRYYTDFAYLTYAYDYAWYGDFPVQEEQFVQLQQHFQTFQHQLPG